MEAPSDSKTIEHENEFLFGPDLLVLPIIEPSITATSVYLPEGQWYDYWTGMIYQGKQLVEIEVQEHYIPLFVRGGAIIPNYPTQQYTGQKQFEQITLRAYCGTHTSELYEDAGDGYDYLNNDYSLRAFSTLSEGNEYVIKTRKRGAF